MTESFEGQPRREEPGVSSEMPLDELFEVIKPFPLLHSMLLLSITNEEWEAYVDTLEAKMGSESEADTPPTAEQSQP